MYEQSGAAPTAMTSQAAPRGDHDLGMSLARALANIKSPTPQLCQAILQDLLGDDRSLWPALRQLTERPGLEALRNHPSSAARMVGRDALLEDIAAWCNQGILERSAEFLNGLLDLPSDVLSLSNGGQQPPVSAETAPAPKSQPAVAVSTREIVQSYCEQAEEAARFGDLKTAILKYSEAIHLDSTNAKLYRQRASLHFKSGDLTAEAQDLTSLLHFDPDDIQMLYRLGTIHAAMLELDVARNKIKTAADRGHVEAREWIASDCLRQAKNEASRGNHIHAIELVTKAMSYGPAFQAADYMLRAASYCAQSNYQEALRDLTEAIRLTPNNSSALYQRGHVFKALSRYKEANADWQAASVLGLAGPSAPSTLQIPSSKRMVVADIIVWATLCAGGFFIVQLYMPSWVMYLAIVLAACIFTTLLKP
jgi:tetratricopeptide (TPR) repeat protein